MWVRYGNTILYKNVFVDADQHVSFAYPNNWTVMTGVATSPYLVATVTSPDIGEYTPSFNVTKEIIPSDMTLDVYVAQTMKQLKGVIADFRGGEANSVSIDGQPAREVSFSGYYLSESFSRDQVYTLKDRTIYVMTYLAPTAEFSGNREEIQRAFRTFNFR